MRNSNHAQVQTRATDATVREPARRSACAVLRMPGLAEQNVRRESPVATITVAVTTVAMVAGLVWQLANSLQVPTIF